MTNGDKGGLRNEWRSEETSPAGEDNETTRVGCSAGYGFDVGDVQGRSAGAAIFVSTTNFEISSNKRATYLPTWGVD